MAIEVEVVGGVGIEVEVVGGVEIDVIVTPPAGAEVTGTGPQGDQGEVAVDSTVTGEPGTSALVEDLDPSTSKALLKFTIPRGDKGSQGDPGPIPGYIHHQSTLSQAWTVRHGLGKHPSVSAEDGAGTVIYGGIEYYDDNVLTISFALTITGRANCT